MEKIIQIIPYPKKDGYLRICIKDKDTYSVWVEEVVYGALVQEINEETNEVEFQCIKDIVEDGGAGCYGTMTDCSSQVVCKINIAGDMDEKSLKLLYHKEIQEYIEMELKKQEKKKQ